MDTDVCNFEITQNLLIDRDHKKICRYLKTTEDYSAMTRFQLISKLRATIPITI